MCRIPRRRGLTLVELLIATAIMTMITLTLGALAAAVQRGSAFAESRAITTQHARVAVARLAQACHGAYANEKFPGFIVLAESSGGANFPDTLVIWRPYDAANPTTFESRLPAAPTGLPLFGELVIYCPNPQRPQELWELRAPGDARTVPLVSDLSSWASSITAIKASAAAHKVVLTERLGTARLNANSPYRGLARFHHRLTPSATSCDQFLAGAVAANSLPWSQGLYSQNAGMRQSWVRFELQLTPTEDSTGPVSPLPVFGSAAIFTLIER